MIVESWKQQRNGVVYLFFLFFSKKHNAFHYFFASSLGCNVMRVSFSYFLLHKPIIINVHTHTKIQHIFFLCYTHSQNIIYIFTAWCHAMQIMRIFSWLFLHSLMQHSNTIIVSSSHKNKKLQKQVGRQEKGTHNLRQT